MIGEYRFFNEYFDGQIVKAESDKFKLFKLLLTSVFSAACLFLTAYGLVNPLLLCLLVLGMIWNFYSPLGKNVSLLFGVLVGIIYCITATTFRLYANAILYIGIYIPLQLMAVSKDYSEGDFVQVKKYITDLNKILFILFFALVTVTFALLSYNLGGRFIIVDAIAAGLLVCSAVLRNERYFEYYIFRIFALLISIALWVTVLIEFGNYDAIPIIMMYSAYLIFDVTNFIYQELTYVNQYMLVVDKYKKSQGDKLAEEKIKVYKKSQIANSKNDNK